MLQLKQPSTSGVSNIWLPGHNQLRAIPPCSLVYWNMGAWPATELFLGHIDIAVVCSRVNKGCGDTALLALLLPNPCHSSLGGTAPLEIIPGESLQPSPCFLYIPQTRVTLAWGNHGLLSSPPIPRGLEQQVKAPLPASHTKDSSPRGRRELAPLLPLS